MNHDGFIESLCRRRVLMTGHDIEDAMRPASHGPVSQSPKHNESGFLGHGSLGSVVILEVVWYESKVCSKSEAGSGDG